MTRTYVRHDSFICCASDLVALRTSVATAHSYLCVRHESLLCAIWLVVCATWLIRLSCFGSFCFLRWCEHDISTCVTWLIYMCDMTRSHVRHGSDICATSLVHLSSFRYIHIYKRVLCIHIHTHIYIYIYVYTYIYTYIYTYSCMYTYIRNTHSGLFCSKTLHYVSSVCRSWQKGLKQSLYRASLTHWQMILKVCVVYVSSVTNEYSLFYRALLQKRPIILRRIIGLFCNPCVVCDKWVKQSLCSASSHIDKWVWNYQSSVCHPWQKSLK